MLHKGWMIKALVAAGLLAAPSLGAGQVGTKAISEDEKVICKRIQEIGSLVKRKKICLTRDQWRRSGDGHEQYARDLADTLRTRPCGDPAACP